MGFEKISSIRASGSGYSARFKKTKTGGVLRISSVGVGEMAARSISYGKNDSVDMFYDSDTEMIAIKKDECGEFKVNAPSTKTKTLVINSKGLADQIAVDVVEYSMDFSNKEFDVILKPKKTSVALGRDK
jgi:hypothetical protein